MSIGCNPSFSAIHSIASSLMNPKCSWYKCSSGMAALLR
jgi:hypothetical protein